MRRIGWIVGMLLLCVMGDLNAQSEDPQSDYQYEYVDYGNGIYLNSRDEVYQDAYGALWVTRSDRLVMYDGKMLTDYPLIAMPDIQVPDVELSIQLDEDLILLCSEDAQIDIWSCRQRGIIRHITITDSIKSLLDEIYHPDETGSIFPMSVMGYDGDRRIYALLRSETQDKFFLLRSLDFGSFELVLSFDADQAMDMEVSAAAIYLSLAGELMVYDHELTLIERYDISADDTDQTYHIELDDEDRLWIYDECSDAACTVYKYEYRDREIVPVPLPAGIDVTPITKLSVIDNEMWIMGVRRAYEYNLETGELTELFSALDAYLSKLDIPPTISHFTGISKSSDGYIWLSSGYGIIKLRKAQSAYNIEMRSDDRFCPSFCSMRGMTQDDEGNLYISYYSGIVKKDNTSGELTALHTYNIDAINSAYSLNYNDGHLYWNDIKINIKTGSTYELIPNKDNGHVTNIVDRQGHIWLSTCYQQQELLELYRHDAATDDLEKIDIPINLQRGGQLTGMSLSRDGSRIWLATARTGAYYIDISDYKVSQIKDSPLQLYSIIEGSRGLIWMGGSGELVAYDQVQDNITSYTREFYNREGLPTAPDFYALIEDRSRGIWCGTSIGLLKLEDETHDFNTFSGYGDIGSTEFNRESAYMDDMGKIYMGTVNGLYSFDPEVLSVDRSSSIYYPINITIAQKYDNNTKDIEPITFGDTEDREIHLAYGDKLLELHYAIPFYSSSQNVLYSHKLEGFNDVWSSPSEEGSVVYTNLLPGDYKLRLQGSISNSATEAQEITIAIHVAQAWYRTIWFYLGLIAAIAAGFYGLYWYRLSQILKIQELRTKISQDLHDDVGSTLTGVAMQSELLEMTVGDNYKEVTHNIATKSRYAMSQMRDIVWAMDANKDSVRDLIDRMRDHVDDALGAMGIDYNYKENVQDESILLKPNVRQAVYLICKESITNITKHSDATHVNITFGVSRNKIELLIKDNGSKVGEAGTSGQGLTSMRNRALTIGGVYRFDYDDDGYQTSLVVPR